MAKSVLHVFVRVDWINEDCFLLWIGNCPPKLFIVPGEEYKYGIV